MYGFLGNLLCFNMKFFLFNFQIINIQDIIRSSTIDGMKDV